MMLVMASLLLILYWIGQIPLAQGQIPRKDELTLTEQTWYNRELEGNSRESMKVLQEKPAPRNSGVVNGVRKKRSEEEALQIEIPLQEYDREQVILTIMAGEERLCAAILHEVHKLVSWGLDQCKIDILKISAYWCFTVKPTTRWNQNKSYLKLEIEIMQMPNIFKEKKHFSQLKEGAACMTRGQNDTITPTMTPVANKTEATSISPTTKPKQTLNKQKQIAGINGWNTLDNR